MTAETLCRMDAVILAGGKGTRLADVVRDVPKPLAPVAGRPFLEHLIERAQTGGLAGTIILSIGYKAEQIRAWCDERMKNTQDKIICVEETEPLGTGGTLRLALASAVTTATAVVMNGDSCVAIDFVAMQLAHQKSGCLLTIAVTEVPDTSRFGEIKIVDERVIAFAEKNGEARAGLINAGVYMIDKKALAFFPQGACSFERDVIPQLLSQGINAYPVTGAFLDIGTPASYAAAAQILGIGTL